MEPANNSVNLHIDPKGRLLNDGIGDVDYLRHTIYAEALARQIETSSCPITVGIFAKWGSGKTFLLKQIQSRLLKSPVKEKKHQRSITWEFSIFLFFVLVCLTAVLFLFIAVPRWFFATDQVSAVRVASSGCILIILLTLIGILSCWETPCSMSFFRVLFYAVFTKLPIGERPRNFQEASHPTKVVLQLQSPSMTDRLLETQVKPIKSTRYINIDFNAWEYAGCDCLWAGIVTKLVKEIEKEFGVLTTRLFRTISLDTSCRKVNNGGHTTCTHLVTNPKTTFMVPNLIWFILVLLILVTLPLIIMCVFTSLPQASVYSTSTMKLVTQVVSFLPISLTALYAAFKVGWAMLHTHTRVITSALQGTKGKFAVQLGFMEKVKTEVTSVIQLVRTVEFIYQVEYKIIISVDDLDRIHLNQVKSVLEAVSILLSDRSAPFVCLIAIDPRVAFQCIEDDMGSALLEANVNGHEYLKKIINLPFCLPEISSSERQRYIIGLIKQADNTITEQRPPTTLQDDSLKHGGHSAGGAAADKDHCYDVVDNSFQNKELNMAEFMYHSRKYFYDDSLIQSILSGNPRHVKRIFNVISLSSIIIERLRKVSTEIIMTKQMAERLVLWVVILDEWPVKMRQIMETISHLERKSILAESNFTEETTLSDFFTRFCLSDSSQSNLIFERFLEKADWLTIKLAKSYLPFTINLYPS